VLHRCTLHRTPAWATAQGAPRSCGDTVRTLMLIKAFITRALMALKMAPQTDPGSGASVYTVLNALATTLRGWLARRAPEPLPPVPAVLPWRGRAVLLRAARASPLARRCRRPGTQHCSTQHTQQDTSARTPHASRHARAMRLRPARARALHALVAGPWRRQRRQRTRRAAHPTAATTEAARQRRRRDGSAMRRVRRPPPRREEARFGGCRLWHPPPPCHGPGVEPGAGRREAGEYAQGSARVQPACGYAVTPLEMPSNTSLMT